MPWLAVMAMLWYAGPAVEDAMRRGPFVAFAAVRCWSPASRVGLRDRPTTRSRWSASDALVMALVAAHVRLYPWARVHGVVLAPLSSTIVGVPMLALLAMWAVVQALIAILGWGDVPSPPSSAGLVLRPPAAPAWSPVT